MAPSSLLQGLFSNPIAKLPVPASGDLGPHPKLLPCEHLYPGDICVSVSAFMHLGDILHSSLMSRGSDISLIRSCILI